MKQLGEAIKARRIEQGITQEKLGLMIGLGNSQAYVHRIESGSIPIGFDNLLKLADALDIQVRDLISF
ncbi:MAG: helix-turn-helix transcriptional regulator [Raoultibacter sp.]